MKPYKCPVCLGKKVVPLGFYDLSKDSVAAAKQNQTEPCRNCEAKGVVYSNREKINFDLIREN